MKQYLDLLKHVHKEGVYKEDRTGTGTYSVFGYQMRFDLSEGFPLVTTKKCHLKSIIHELLWFLKGDTNIAYLNENGVRIWDEWADENGDLGPVYGSQWRSWPTVSFKETELSKASGGVAGGSEVTIGTIDQIANVIQTLKTNPDSRRIIVSAWNPAEVDKMALPPCHALFQFYTVEISQEERVRMLAEAMDVSCPTWTEDDYDYLESDVMPLFNIPERKLSCQLYQRSADIFLGVPFNIASYALLTMMIAQVVNMVPGDFVWTGGDTHLYSNHTEQALTQMAREPFPLPTMKINRSVNDIFRFKYEDFELVGYEAHPHIAAKVAV